MANKVEKLNTIAITDIEKVNTLVDDDIEDINTLEFTGTPTYMTATGGTISTDGDYKVHTQNPLTRPHLVRLPNPLTSRLSQWVGEPD